VTPASHRSGGPAAARRAAADAAARERMAQVGARILARAPEHDLVPSLDRIAAVCRLLGDPQRSFGVVHLTGTNGKTSTTRMVERLLREHGLRTGRFTSPHLVDLRERICLDGTPLPPDRFAEAYQELEPYLDLVDAGSAERGEPRMTFFEVLVALAFAVFADAPVDVAAIEVGMGGSWDATNVADGSVAVIMPIGLDHERFLGHDVAAIATEKAGIIKAGAVAVIAEQPPEALEVLLEHAARVDATVVLEGRDFGVSRRELALGGQLVALSGLSGVYEEIFLPLHGVHQARNAACALAAVEALLATRSEDLGSGLGAPMGPARLPVPTGSPSLDVEVVRAAFVDVDSPGRLEVVRRSPTVLVDAAHNPAGARVLAEALTDTFSFSRLVGVVGVLADKDALGILVALGDVLDEVVITRSSSARSMPVEELAEIAREVFDDDRVHLCERLDDALTLAIERCEYDDLPGGGVLATGSVTVAAEVRTLLGRPVG